MPRVSYVIIALTNRQCGGGMRYNADDPGTLVVPERERNPRGTETKGVASISSFRYFYYLLPSSTMCNMSVDIDHSLRNNRNHRNTMSPLSLSLLCTKTCSLLLYHYVPKCKHHLYIETKLNGAFMSGQGGTQLPA